MASLGNPRSWVPYMNSKDCSQGFCSLYCPQWCYVVYPPPPPPLELPAGQDSAPTFSPLVIAIIGVLASAFLLVSYYTLISKYCGGRDRRGDLPSGRASEILELDDNHDPSFHEPWHHPTAGLDEALIKTITCCNYSKGEGLVGGTDCSVCLGEFQDGESIRLLPKCSHAFHVSCIDTWLRSHSNCPLCRAGIFTFSNSDTPFCHVSPPSVLVEDASSSSENNNTRQHRDADENVLANGTIEIELEHDVVEQVVPKTVSGFRAFSDLGNLRGRHSVIQIIRDEEYYESIRRSVSMDHSLQIGDVLLQRVMNQDQQVSQVEVFSNEEAGTSKRSRGNYRRRVLHCVLSPIAMKRSFSSGRFSLSRNGRGKQGIFPV